MARDHSSRCGGEIQAACLTSRKAALRALSSAELMRVLLAVRGSDEVWCLQQLRLAHMPCPLPSTDTYGAAAARLGQGAATWTPAFHDRKGASGSDRASPT